ncbi:UNVERIFIED_CONTAM: Protodermal factor 1 [Sesamum radiatum]|uniref:Protodermal factor 1 n=1 Tax=Sesamum radiatum TaxID=300843 RepID=A0AAW2KII3_SESRA
MTLNCFALVNCSYWRNHPTLIWGLFGWWGTLGSAFGLTSVPGFSANMNLLQALSNTRTDGLGELYREGTAALLNSMAHTRFPYTTTRSEIVLLQHSAQTRLQQLRHSSSSWLTRAETSPELDKH